MKAERKNLLCRAGAILFWLLLWQLLAELKVFAFFLASPVAALRRLIELAAGAQFWWTLLLSLARVVGGYFIGATLGVLFALLSFSFKAARYLFSPLVTTARTVPVASFVILLLFFTNQDSLALWVVAIICMPIYYQRFLAALEAQDRELLELNRVFFVPAANKWRYYYSGAFLPALDNAATIAVGLAFKSGVAAEVIALARNSIGLNLYEAKVYLIPENLFAWTIVIVVLSALFTKTMNLLHLLLWRWGGRHSLLGAAINGSNTPTGDNALAGSNAVNGDNALAGSNAVNGGKDE